MIRKVCTCDICSKEMAIKGQYALGYEFKRYLLTDCDIKNKMDICTDCFNKSIREKDIACTECGTFFDWSKRASIKVIRTIEWK